MVLLIGYGNTLRRDDGAGVVLVEMIAREAGGDVRTVTTHQLLPELAEEIAGADLDMVIFCDATQAVGPNDEPVRLKRLAPATGGGAIGHQLSPETLLVLAGKLYGRTPPAWLVTVTGYDFGHGEGLGDQAGKALEMAAERISSLLMDSR